MNRTRRYSPEVRERAVRLVFAQEAEHASQWAAIEGSAHFVRDGHDKPSVVGSPTNMSQLRCHGRTHRHYSMPMPFLSPNNICCGCSDFSVGLAASGSGDVGRLPQPPAEIRTISSAVTGASTRGMDLGFIGSSRCG